MGGYPDYMVLVSTRGVHPPKPMMHILHISEHVSESIWEGHASFPTPAWQVAGGTNLLMSFPLNCGQRFSVPQCSFRAQQLLGGLLASWMRKRLRSIEGRPLIMMKIISESTAIPSSRGIQYVHCVMDKCIMFKLGERKNTKYVKNM